jgi:hypothetical protein
MLDKELEEPIAKKVKNMLKLLTLYCALDWRTGLWYRT